MYVIFTRYEADGSAVNFNHGNSTLIKIVVNWFTLSSSSSSSGLACSVFHDTLPPPFSVFTLSMIVFLHEGLQKPFWFRLSGQVFIQKYLDTRSVSVFDHFIA